MIGSWIASARHGLIQDHGRSQGWGYRPEAAPSVEPTVLTCLGLLATGRPDGDGEGAMTAAVRRSADWLGSLQGRDGGLGVSADLPEAGWSTPYAILLWAALGGHAPRRVRAVRWLLGRKGIAVPNLPPAEATVGHDTTLVGWSWVADTHSWLEPTALAVLALRRAGKADHPRVREGLRLIGDRAIAGGGWNYGNNRVFGRDLRAQPAPTGLALLALAGEEEPSETVDRAIEYLLAALPETRAAQSLCWGVLGLRAWGRCPDAAAGWLEEAHELAGVRHAAGAGPRSSQLLLAAGETSLELLGLARDAGRTMT
jgi:hypothetical protein